MTSEAAPSSDPDPDASTPPRPSPPPAPSTTGATTPDTIPATTKPPPSAKAKQALRTRAGYTWVGLVAAAIIGAIVLIFILQNLNQVRVTLFFWSFSLPLGITVLLSLIAGVLAMGLAGGWRILQLRRATKRG